MDELVLVRRDGPVATVTMARPEVHNAFNEHLIAQLREAFDSLRDDGGVRVVVLAGEGKSFSAGADLDWMRRAASFSEEENLRDAASAAALWRAVAECPKPVVARVHGNAFGGGAGLVAASDIAIASEQTMFGFTEVRLGLVPATVAPHVVEKIGPGRALPLFLTGERFDARRAFEIGLVHQVVPDAEMDVAVGTVVDQLLSGGRSATSPRKTEPGSMSTPLGSSPRRGRGKKAVRASPRSSKRGSLGGSLTPGPSPVRGRGERAEAGKPRLRRRVRAKVKDCDVLPHPYR